MKAIDDARAAQRDVIFNWMLSRYAGGGRQIQRWDDFSYSLCWFFTWSGTCGASTRTTRRALNELAAEGVIERRQDRSGGPIRYRFPREICDTFAAEAVAHYQAMGYSQHEIRPEVRPDFATTNQEIST